MVTGSPNVTIEEVSEVVSSIRTDTDYSHCKGRMVRIRVGCNGGLDSLLLPGARDRLRYKQYIRSPEELLGRNSDGKVSSLPTREQGGPVLRADRGLNRMRTEMRRIFRRECSFSQ